jgi:hypothetical protein
MVVVVSQAATGDYVNRKREMFLIQYTYSLGVEKEYRRSGKKKR